GDHRRAGAPGDRPGVRPGHLRRRPAVLRHAVRPRGSLKQAVDRFHAGAELKADPGRRALERQELRWFLDVCDAIDYAHIRGPAGEIIGPGHQFWSRIPTGRSRVGGDAAYRRPIASRSFGESVIRVVAPASPRILAAMRSFAGARMLKWLTPFTGR